MRTLIIETATAACSVALVEAGSVIAAAHQEVGRGHAERLLPMIAELPGGGRAESILVDCGPGSFTGVRVGLAAARGLALGWGSAISGYSSLPLIAAATFAENADLAALAVVIEGGHGEVFMQAFSSPPFAADAPMRSVLPADALAALGGRMPVGSGVRHLVALDPALTVIPALPRAADAILLPAAFRALPPVPIYGRAPDAIPAAAR